VRFFFYYYCFGESFPEMRVRTLASMMLMMAIPLTSEQPAAK